MGVRERKKTNLCFVAHETFRNGIHRMEHEQLSNTYNNIELMSLHVQQNNSVIWVKARTWSPRTQNTSRPRFLAFATKNRSHSEWKYEKSPCTKRFREVLLVVLVTESRVVRKTRGREGIKSKEQEPQGILHRTMRFAGIMIHPTSRSLLEIQVKRCQRTKQQFLKFLPSVPQICFSAKSDSGL